MNFILIKHFFKQSSPSDSDRCIQSKLGDFSLVKHIIGEKNDSMLIGIQTGIQSPAALRQPMMPGFPGQNNRGPSSTYPYHQVMSLPLHSRSPIIFNFCFSAASTVQQ